MGLLSDELIEQDFAQFDCFFKLHTWDVNPAVRIQQPWEISEKDNLLYHLRDIDMITDDKGRVRLNKEQLIEMILNHLVDPTKIGMVRGNVPEVSISSTATHVYYTINTKFKMLDDFFSTSRMVARITLEKII